MNSKYIYISSNEWFENSSLKNPIYSLDPKLEIIYPEFSNLDYDLKLLITKPATIAEKSMPFYNNYREKYGNPDIHTLQDAVHNSTGKHVFLNGFDDEHLQFITPLIKDSVEILYLFKCPKIHSFSVLSEYKHLKCILVYWNNTVEELWNITSNKDLKAISFVSVSKLRNIDGLSNSNVEYVCLDSSDNSGNKKDVSFDIGTFNQMKKLKHLKLLYKNCNIDY